MTVLDWIIIGTVSVVILSGCFFLTTSWFFVKTHQKQRELGQALPKSKRTKQRIQRKMGQLTRKKQQLLMVGVGLLMLGGLSGMGALYVKDYQGKTLSAENQKAIVDGYYYLEELDKELNSIEEGQFETAAGNIRQLSSWLAAFATQQANEQLNPENQVILNRYFTSVQSLGVNLPLQLETLGNQQEMLVEVREDLTKVLAYQKVVSDTFSINEKALREKQ